MMSIGTAFNLLDITDYTKLDHVYIRKSYKKKLKTCHPDLLKDTTQTASNLGEAYNIICDELKLLKTDEDLRQFFNENKAIKSPSVFNLKQVVEVYRGNIQFDNKGREITKSRLKQDDALISIEVQLILNGNELNRTYSLKKKISDRYILDYDVYCNIGDSLNIKILDQTKEVIMTGSRISLQYNFDYFVNINFIVTRKEAV